MLDDSHNTQLGGICYLLNIVLRGQFRDGALQIVYAVPSFRVLQADDGTGSKTARRQRRDCQLQPMRLG